MKSELCIVQSCLGSKMKAPRAENEAARRSRPGEGVEIGLGGRGDKILLKNYVFSETQEGSAAEAVACK